MQVKVITWLGILLIAALLMISVDDLALARHDKKNTDNQEDRDKRPLPTIRPYPDRDNRSTVTPTAAPAATPAPTPTPTTAPVPDNTPVPVPEPVSPPMPTARQYSQPDYYATPVTTPDPTPTPGPDLAPSQNATAVFSSPPVTPIPTFSPMMTGTEPVRPGLSPWVIISALMGLACIGYLTYLGFMMIRR